MKHLAKDALSEGARMRIRRLGRLRWRTKARVVRFNRQPLRRWWRYVLWDPEVDSFTYGISNHDELADALAQLLDADPEQMRRTVREASADPLLADALRQPVLRLMWTKRQPPLHGLLLTHWAVIRTLRPACVAEAGVLDGMGTTVMLAALERNAREGDEGKLASIDIMPNAGELVPASLRHRWTFACGDSATQLGPLLVGERVGYFVSDSLPRDEHVRAELDSVRPHAADRLVGAASWGALRAFDDAGAEVIRCYDQPVDHFYEGRKFAVARF